MSNRVRPFLRDARGKFSTRELAWHAGNLTNAQDCKGSGCYQSARRYTPIALGRQVRLNYTISRQNIPLKKNTYQGWGHSSVVQRTGYSLRGPRFNFQHLHSGSEPPVTLVPRDPKPPSNVHEHQAFICCIYTCSGKTPINFQLGMVVHSFNPCTWKAEAARSLRV